MPFKVKLIKAVQVICVMISVAGMLVIVQQFSQLVQTAFEFGKLKPIIVPLLAAWGGLGVCFGLQQIVERIAAPRGRVLRLSHSEWLLLMMAEGRKQKLKEVRVKYRKIIYTSLMAVYVLFGLLFLQGWALRNAPGCFSWYAVIGIGVFMIVGTILLAWFNYILPWRIVRIFTKEAIGKDREVEALAAAGKYDFPVSQAEDNKRIMALARRNPPRCLQSFALSRRSRFVSLIEGSKTNVVYQLKCECGGNQFMVHGFRYPERERNGVPNLLAPISSECSKCGSVKVVFDDATDGYDALIGFESERSDPHEGRVLEGIYHLVVSFEYSMTDDEIDDFPDLTAGKGGDYFTWISIYGIQDGNEPQLLFDWECA